MHIFLCIYARDQRTIVGVVTEHIIQKRTEDVCMSDMCIGAGMHVYVFVVGEHTYNYMQCVFYDAFTFVVMSFLSSCMSLSNST